MVLSNWLSQRRFDIFLVFSNLWWNLAAVKKQVLLWANLMRFLVVNGGGIIWQRWSKRALERQILWDSSSSMVLEVSSGEATRYWANFDVMIIGFPWCCNLSQFGCDSLLPTVLEFGAIEPILMPVFVFNGLEIWSYWANFDVLLGFPWCMNFGAIDPELWCHYSVSMVLKFGAIERALMSFFRFSSAEIWSY